MPQLVNDDQDQAKTVAMRNSLLRWRRHWRGARCDGLTIGLIDGDPGTGGGDTIRIHRFADACGEHAREHAMFSTGLLHGGGATHPGLAPGARLRVAAVIGDDGAATSTAVAAAIDWLIDSRVDVIAIPLGQVSGCPAVAAAMVQAALAGVPVFCAAGNDHPLDLLFPAAHRDAIAVGASRPGHGLMDSCCRRPRLDLVVPSWRVSAIDASGRRVRRSGSSVACVIAAAAAAQAIAAGDLPSRPGRAAVLRVLTPVRRAPNPPVP